MTSPYPCPMCGYDPADDDRIRELEAEVAALRRALIHVADLQLRSYEDTVHIIAYRRAANDLDKPFSDARVTEEMARMRKR